MLRYLTKKRKLTRKEKNHEAVKEIYRRGAGTVAADRLAVHQESPPETKEKLLAAAQARRDQRNARRLPVK